MLSLSRKLTQLPTSLRRICTTTTCFLDQKWRERNGLPANPNAFGPLTNLPDFHYVDGRPAPLGSNMRKRLQKQKQTAERIVTLCKQLNYAKERSVEMAENKISSEKQRLDRRLKLKGSLLLKKT